MNAQMLILDYQGRKPIYIQIEEQIEKFIALGILKEKDALPSIREVASTLGINPNTVKKAYDLLEAKKLIVIISTKGCFVSHAIEKAKQEKIEQLYQTIKEAIDELTQLGLSKDDILKHLSNK